VVAEAGVVSTTHTELQAHLADLLEDALHSDDCYINPDETVCVCLIGRVRAVLAHCEERRGQWLCIRPAHPDSPHRHVFASVA